MKNIKSVIIFLALFLLPSMAMAGQCPALVKKVNEQLTKSNLSAEKKAEIVKLKDQGETLHKSGDHANSEKALNEALAKLKG